MSSYELDGLSLHP